MNSPGRNKPKVLSLRPQLQLKTLSHFPLPEFRTLESGFPVHTSMRSQVLARLNVKSVHDSPTSKQSSPRKNMDYKNMVNSIQENYDAIYVSSIMIPKSKRKDRISTLDKCTKLQIPDGRYCYAQNALHQLKQTGRRSPFLQFRALGPRIGVSIKRKAESMKHLAPMNFHVKL